MKLCNMCGVEKPATNKYFPRRKDEVLRGECKLCSAKYHVSWSKSNIKRSREIKAKWNKANPEKHRGDPVKQRASEKKWRKENPERFLNSQRKHHLRKTYNLTSEDFDRMLEEQDGKCDLCGISQTKTYGSLCVDHNHETGKVRALLCKKCNFIVGAIENSPETAESVRTYLFNHNYQDYSI